MVKCFLLFALWTELWTHTRAPELTWLHFSNPVFYQVPRALFWKAASLPLSSFKFAKPSKNHQGEGCQTSALHLETVQGNPCWCSFSIRLAKCLEKLSWFQYHLFPFTVTWLWFSFPIMYNSVPLEALYLDPGCILHLPKLALDEIRLIECVVKAELPL